MIFGYARVSTNDQNLDMQLDALQSYGCESIFEEKMTGTRLDRPQLSEMLKYLREGDTVVVYKLDRLGRSTKQLIELVEDLQDRGIEFVSLRDSIDTKSAIGKAMFRMLAVLAEMERDLIVERTQAGLQAARARGRFGGRPKKDSKKVEMAIKMYDSKQHTVKEISEITGVSRTTLYTAISKRKTEHVVS